MDDLGGAVLAHPVGEGDHIEGNPAAPLTLLEYGDFECPQCGQAYPIVQEVRRAMGDRLRFVFRHFPLTNAHHHAQRAAETAEWAAAQGQFWQMYDALYEDQAHLDDRHLLARATALGLSPGALERAWAEHTFIRRVKDDFRGGLASGVDGTPTFFINGTQHQGAWDAASLLAALNARAEAPRDPATPARGAGPPR
jgi:protein-disulfide isomerase